MGFILFYFILFLENNNDMQYPSIVSVWELDRRLPKLRYSLDDLQP